MYAFIIVLHVIVCALLVTIILMQSGRGGGLTEGFAAAESMFGAKTNVVLVRATTVLSILFFIMCLSLAFLSTKQSESLMEGVAATQQEAASAAADTQKQQEDAAQSMPETQPAEDSPSLPQTP